MKKIILSILFSLCILQAPLLINASENNNDLNLLNHKIKQQITRAEIISEFYNKCYEQINYNFYNIKMALLEVQTLISIYNYELRNYGYIELKEHEINKPLNMIRSINCNN